MSCRSKRGGAAKNCASAARCAHFRQPVLAALLGGFDGDGLPFLPFLRGVLGLEANDGAIGDERHDRGGADLDCFLHDQIHVFSLRNGLAESDAATQRRGVAFVQFPQGDLARTKRSDLGGDLAARPLKRTALSPGWSRRTVRA